MSAIGKKTNCYICDSNEVRLYKEINGFLLYECKDCKLIWVGEGINGSKIELFYDQNYYNSNSKVGYRNYLSDEENHRKNARNILSIVDRIRDLSNLCILDVGCACGFLLDEARRLKGCEVYGIEISPYTCEYAKKRLGLNVINVELTQYTLDGNYFDVVFLIGTLEHLKSPKEALLNIKKILKPDGLLVITTIDTTAPFSLYSIKPPEHLYYFNNNNLRLLLNKLRYKILFKKTYFSNYYLHDLFYRLSEFTSLSFLRFFSNIYKKIMPKFSIKIPTNEMIVIAKKVSI